MGIEALGSIGSALGSVASGVGKGACPVATGLAKFGPELKGVYLPKVINEGPVSHADLINTMPILKIGKLNPIKEMRFNEPASVPSVITEAEVATRIMPQIESTIEPWVLPEPQRIVETQPKLHRATEVRVANRPVQSTSSAVSPALQEQEVEELVEEKKEVEKPKETLEEEKITERKIFVEDIEVSAQRRFDIKVAIKKAKEIAEKLGLKNIAGKLVAKFLPVEYAGIRSQVIKEKGPDGSYQETIEEIAEVGELESEEKAIERFNWIVAEKKPVKSGKEGIPVEIRDIARVFKYRFLKPVQAHVEVINRVKKKKLLAPRQTVLSLDPSQVNVGLDKV